MDAFVQPCAPQFEHHETGLGIGHSSPRLSWKFTTPGPRHPRDWTQRAYDLQIHRDVQGQKQTHHVESDQSILVSWPWEPLQSREVAHVRVRCYGNDKERTTTPWSDWATIEASLLHQGDWHSAFITSSRPVDPAAPLSPIRFRKVFELPATCFPMARARLYITALGVYHAYLNGVRIGGHCMAPGWTAYDHRLNFQTFDVAGLLRQGVVNVLAVEVGAGWYATRLGFHEGKRCCYRSPNLAVLAQLEVAVDTTGVSWVLPSNDTWDCLPSAIVSSEIYDGEVYDMRRESHAWLTSAKDKEQAAARVVPGPQASLVSPDAPPVRVVQEISVMQILTSPSGKVILDFGQNLVGKVRIRTTVIPHGKQLSLTHAEVLQDGELCTRPLRTAKCTDIVLGSGDELSNWTPAFTFHGFRYVQVDGWPGREQPSPDDFVALVMHTDLSRRGWFACSNSHINSLHANIVWGMRGNFVSVPTDCPQRDERLGWTGDLQVFSSTAAYLYNTTGMLAEWLQDLSAEHLEDHRGGVPPLVVPDVLQKEAGKSLAQAVWGDAVVIVPDVLHRYSADTSILHRQYSSMKAWLDRGIPRGPDGLWNEVTWQLGDWLDPTALPDEPMNARTDGTLVADAYLVHITSTLASICQKTGHAADAEHYTAATQHLRSAFAEKYISPQGNIMSNTQTAIALAICFSLYRNIEQRRTAAASLSRLVRRGKFALTTGFVGTKFIADALTLTCQPALAYRMLLTKKCPSWLYPVTQGATTVWERWDSIRPDGSVNPGEMTSFNHYALGSIANWLHTSVAGVEPLEPGWKTVRIRPVVGGELSWAETRFDGPYGQVRCRWEVSQGRFSMGVQIPPNARALVILPSEQRTEITDDEEPRGKWVGSGVYEFSCAYTAREEWPPRPLLGPFQRDNLEDIWADSNGVGEFTMADLRAGHSEP